MLPSGKYWQRVEWRPIFESDVFADVATAGEANLAGLTLVNGVRVSVEKFGCHKLFVIL